MKRFYRIIVFLFLAALLLPGVSVRSTQKLQRLVIRAPLGYEPGRAAVKLESLPGLYIVDVPSGKSSLSLALEMLRSGEAVEVQLDFPTRIYRNTNGRPPEITGLWGLDNRVACAHPPLPCLPLCTDDFDIDGPEAWAISQGEGVVVATVDTGVDYNHPQLRDNIWTDPVDGTHGRNFSPDALDKTDPMDDNGHGTHVAGIIAAVKDDVFPVGVAPKAKIVAVKAFDSQGQGTFATALQAYDYIISLAKRGIPVRVINDSWGGEAPISDLPLLADAFREAARLGITSAVAAGNSFKDIEFHPFSPGSWEPDVPGLISVAAANSNSGLAFFSSFSRNNVSVAAPGCAVGSTWPSDMTSYQSGTSMAAPHVAGVAALVYSINKNETPGSVREIIRASAGKWENLAIYVRSGMLNAERAVEIAITRRK